MEITRGENTFSAKLGDLQIMLKKMNLIVHAYYSPCFNQKGTTNGVIFRNIESISSESSWLLKIAVKLSNATYCCDVYVAPKEYIDCLMEYFENSITGTDSAGKCNRCTCNVSAMGEQQVSIKFSKNGMTQCYYVANKVPFFIM